MSALSSSDFIADWAGRLQDAADRPADTGFDGRRALPEFLRESAVEQADKVFLLLDSTPVERRDLEEGARLVENAGLEFLLAWANVMHAFGSDREPWAKDAAEAAVATYHARLDELALGLHAGGQA